MRADEIHFCPGCGTGLVETIRFGRLRPTCPACNWVFFPDPKVAAAALVLKADQVLLVQRANQPFQGFWTLPGGFVDAGEDPQQAAERECLEETGLVVRSTRLVDVIARTEHTRGADILIVYAAQEQSGELAAGDDALQARYFSLSALPPLAFESTKQIFLHLGQERF